MSISSLMLTLEYDFILCKSSTLATGFLTILQIIS
jgi:hypothetical protein